MFLENGNRGHFRMTRLPCYRSQSVLLYSANVTWTTLRGGVDLAILNLRLYTEYRYHHGCIMICANDLKCARAFFGCVICSNDKFQLKLFSNTFFCCKRSTLAKQYARRSACGLAWQVLT